MIRLLILSIFVLLSGCATNKGTINTFYEPSYNVGSVKTLAVPTIRNARLAPSESQQIGRSVNKAIAQKNPSITLVSANKFANLINDLGLVDDYSDFIEDYVTSGIANREFLEQLRNNNIDAIMLSELSNSYQQDGAYGRNKAQTRITLSFTIMNTHTNDVIWTASSDGIKGSATTVAEAPALIEAINLAVKKIEQSVPQL
jgi:hypothetical protein